MGESQNEAVITVPMTIKMSMTMNFKDIAQP